VLLVEGPDSASPWTRLGRYWRCWFQPQHQHFITCENLLTELEAQGFDILSVQRAEAGEGRDLVVAASLWVGDLQGPPILPWIPTASLGRRVLRPLIAVATWPVLAAAFAVDVVKDVWDTRPGSTTPGNAYRIVARRREGAREGDVAVGAR
jgi:hypothetical protein